MDSYNKPYPISKNNFQCIGPCYQSSTTIVHPVTLEYVTDRSNPFCPIRQKEFVDKNTGKKKTVTIDICNQPTETKDVSGKEFEINILTPSIDFNDTHFINIYYDIYSYEDAINYITENKYLPILTKLRIIDCSLNAYGKELNIVDHRTVDFFIEVINKLWLNELYYKIEKYINVDTQNDKINLSSYDDNNNDDDNNDNYNIKKIKYNYIRTKFITSDEILKFLIKYINHRKDTWDEISHHIDSIKDDFIIYIENKIKSTIK